MILETKKKAMAEMKIQLPNSFKVLLETTQPMEPLSPLYLYNLSHEKKYIFIEAA